MKKAQTKELFDIAVKDFIDVCPHCGTKAHLQMLFNESYSDKNGDVTYYIVFRCVPCKKLVLETYKFKQNIYTSEEKLEMIGWEDKFPTNETTFINKFEEIVPDDVLEDFKEGVISLQNKCYRASVSMFRRSLQSAVIDLGAKSEEDLITQIKNLGNLTTEIKDWAHNIRIFGNWGAHPQDDNLKEVDLKLATETQSFLEEFFNYVYVMPSRVAKARQVGKPKEESQETDK